MNSKSSLLELSKQMERLATASRKTQRSLAEAAKKLEKQYE